MHILLIHAYFLPDSAAGSVRWNEMVRHWAAAGHRVTVLAGSVDYLTGKPYAHSLNLVIEQATSGVRVVRVGMSSRYNRGRWGRLWAYWTFFWNSLFAGLFRVREKIDVVLATSPPLTVGLIGWVLSCFWRVPFVLEVRDLWPDVPVQLGYLQNTLLARLAYRLERFLYHRAAHIVTLTPAFEQILIEQKDMPPDLCTTIANGADLALIEQALAHFDRDAFRRINGLNRQFWIIYAGAHGPANGLRVVLEAANAMRDEPVGFLFLGDGPEKTGLQAEAVRRQLSNVRFLPGMPKADVLRWVAAADAGLVVMQPISIFQTMLSAKLFDYLACGKPTLTAIDGLTRQLAEQHGFGLYVNPRKPQDWIDQIRLYLDTPGLVVKHGDNGRRFVCQHADRANLAHRYLTILNRVHSPH